MKNKKNTLAQSEKNELNELISKAADLENQSKPAISGKKTESAFQTVKRKSGIRSQSRSKFKISRLQFAAAAVFLLFAFGIAYLIIPHEIKTERGAIRTVELPDQSTVTLNGNSTLTYSRWFGWGNRTVTLHGDAFFEVTKTGKPFTVITGNAQITVLGTAFSVRTGTADSLNKTVVYLKEGKVSFAPKNRQEQAIVLEAGQLSWISEKHPLPVPPKTANQSKVMNWLQKDLSFTNQPLSEIFDELEKRYNIEFKIKSKQILQEKLTIYISNPKGIEQAVRDICRAKGYHFIRKNNTFIISK